MNSIRILAAVALTLSADLCLGYDYNAQTGALSYTFFNLSPNTCYVTSYQGGTVPGAYAEPASLYGWYNGPNWLCSFGKDGEDTGVAASFFNPSGIADACVNGQSGSGAADGIITYFFYDWGGWLDTSSAAPSASLNSGTALTTVEYSTASTTGANYGINPPALGDSWTIQCGGGTDGTCAAGGTCSGTVVMANLTSAANMFISGQGDPLNGYFLNTLIGNFPNSGINPQSPGSPDYNTTNPLGVGFVSSTLNMNPTGSTSGGLWLGLSNPNSGSQAAYAINAAMYPLNLSTYVGSINVNSSLGMAVTPIYGGHLTLAIGDPFLVSSFAAKTLWYMVSAPTISLSASTLDADGMGTLINLLVNGGSSQGTTVSPVFPSTTAAFSYLQWLLGTGSGSTAASWGAAGTAASVVDTMNTAASTPITHESFWGKLITASLNFGVDVLNDNIPTLLGGSTYINNTAKAAGADADGALLTPITSAITADFTSTTSLPAPTMANAQPVVNNTYSSSDLLGMLLANGFAQAAIDNTVFSAAATSGDQLYANYTISDVNSSGVALYCTGINVATNLLSGNCYTTDSSGTLTTTTVSNDCTQSSAAGAASCPQSYLNALATAPGAQSNTQLSIWDAILTGSDITTVQSTSGAANNGYMMMQNPAIPAFSPPTQMVNATLNWPLYVSAVNTTFNLSSGLLSLASYGNVTAPVPSLNNPTPTATPQLDLALSAAPMAGQGIQFATPSSPSYDASTGILSVAWYMGYSNQTPQWWGEDCANGTQSINMAQCPDNAVVTLVLTPNPAYGNQYGASCALQCGGTFPLGASGSSTVAAVMPTVTVITPPSNAYMDGVTVAIAPVSTATTSTTPISTYDSSTGLLTVQGYTTTYTGGSSTVAFQNGTQTLDTTTCPAGNTNVAFTFYPTSSQNVSDPTGLGFLSCQALSLPYVLCTMDQNASGGVLAVITGTGASASIELACACIPPYLSGPAVASGNANYLNTGTSAAPQGIMLGATSSNPTQICTGN